MMAKLTFVLYIKQVKKMSTDIPFILDALLTSSTVEVQVRFSHSFCSEIFFLHVCWKDFGGGGWFGLQLKNLIFSNGFNGFFLEL